MNTLPIILLFVGGLILTVGDVVMKKWVVTSNQITYAIGLFLYFIGLNFLAQSYKYKNIAVASATFVIFNIVTLSIVSWIFFKEKLSTLELVGILTGIVSIVILELSE